MTENVFTSDFKQTPYWWDTTPRPDLGSPDLPDTVDIMIIGSGYTGLCAALETARAGRETLVIDAQDAGWGCSSRNGGIISSEIKPSFDELTKKYGEKAAFDMVHEGHSALAWITDFVKSEGLDCDFDVSGEFYGAHNPAKFKKLSTHFSNQRKGLEIQGHIVPKSELHTEIGTKAYHGGLVHAKHASVDPARLHQAILERVQKAGATIVPYCQATSIEKDGSGFVVTTAKGKVKAREVIVATNGYTDGVSPWMQRRVIPIGSYMIATEPLPKELMDRLMPTNRPIVETRKVVYYYRPSPDRSRIIFGGRVTGGETDPVKSGPLLARDLCKLFPELSAYKISHTWMGYIAFTFDHMAHIGQHDGVHYAMGYCGSGISMSGYLGTRIAQQVLGKPEGKTAFDDLKFQTRPLYNGKPWFLSASVAYFKLLDRFNI